jgi:hypothetical protein
MTGFFGVKFPVDQFVAKSDSMILENATTSRNEAYMRKTIIVIAAALLWPIVCTAQSRQDRTSAASAAAEAIVAKEVHQQPVVVLLSDKERSLNAAVAVRLGIPSREKAAVIVCSEPSNPATCSMKTANAAIFVGDPVFSGDTAVVIIGIATRTPSTLQPVAWESYRVLVRRDRGTWRVLEKSLYLAT